MEHAVPLKMKRNINLVYLIAFFGNGFFERAIWMIYLLEKHYSLVEIGLLQALINVMMLICDVPTGIIADRIGRKNSLVIGRLLLVLYFVGMMISSNFYVIALAFICLGVGFTFISGAEEALLFDSAKAAGKEEEFSRIVGRYFAAIKFILAVAMLLGGYMKGISWTMVFGISIVFQIVALLLVLFLQEVQLEKTQEERPTFKAIMLDTASFLKMNRAIRYLITGIALLMGIVSLYLMFTQDSLNQAGYSAFVIAGVFAAESLLSTFASAKVYVFEKKYSTRAVLVTSTVIILALFVLAGMHANFLQIIGFLILGPVFCLFDTISFSLINAEIPSEQRATLLSVLSFLSSLVMTVLSPVIGYFGEHFSTARALSLSGIILSLLSLACIAYYFKSRQSVAPNVTDSSAKEMN